MRLSILLLLIWAACNCYASAAEPVGTSEHGWLARQIDTVYQQSSQRQFVPVISDLASLEIPIRSLELKPEVVRPVRATGNWCGSIPTDFNFRVERAIKAGRYFHFYFPNGAVYRPLDRLQSFYRSEFRHYGEKGRLIGYAEPARIPAADWLLNRRLGSFQWTSFELPEESFGMQW